MAAELIVAPEAEQDVADAYAWYENRRPGLGEEFLGCVDPAWKGSAALPKYTHLSTKTIAVAWYGDSRMLCFTNTKKGR